MGGLGQLLFSKISSQLQEKFTLGTGYSSGWQGRRKRLVYASIKSYLANLQWSIAFQSTCLCVANELWPSSGSRWPEAFVLFHKIIVKQVKSCYSYLGEEEWRTKDLQWWACVVRGLVQTFRSEKPWPKGCSMLLPAGLLTVLAVWIRAAEQEAKPAWSQLLHCLVRARAWLPQPWNAS